MSLTRPFCHVCRDKRVALNKEQGKLGGSRKRHIKLTAEQEELGKQLDKIAAQLETEGRRTSS